MKFLMSLLAAVLATSVPAQDLKRFTDARVSFEKDLQRVTEPLYRRYVADLEKIKRDLGKAGDAKGAMTVQREIDAATKVLDGGEKVAAEPEKEIEKALKPDAEVNKVLPGVETRGKMSGASGYHSSFSFDLVVTKTQKNGLVVRAWVAAGWKTPTRATSNGDVYLIRQPRTPESETVVAHWSPETVTTTVSSEEEPLEKFQEMQVVLPGPLQPGIYTVVFQYTGGKQGLIFKQVLVE